MSAHCRIGRVTYKAAPHLSVLEQPIKGADIAAALTTATRKVIDLNPQLAGFAIVAWDFRGLATTSARTHQDSPIRAAYVPGFAAENLRSRNMEDTARKVAAGEDV